MKMWRIEEIDLERVNPWSHNPRKMSDKNRSGLEASLNRFNYVDLIVWNETTGNIVSGHQRYDILVDKGVKRAKVIVVNLSEEDELGANLTMNNPEIEGEWDSPIDDLLHQVESIDETLFGDVNFDSLRDKIEKTAVNEPDCSTKCPCCGHKWEATDSDVRLMTRQEQLEMQK